MSSAGKEEGRYILRKISKSRSSRVAVGAGQISKGRFLARRFSIKRRSSSSVAIALRGPTRIQARPWKRTGGASDGSTIIAAISQPNKTLFCTVIVGKGGI